MKNSSKRIYYGLIIKVSQVIIEILFLQEARKMRFLVVVLSEQMYQLMYGDKSVDKTRIKERKKWKLRLGISFTNSFVI
jgi:hypothetical protein